MLGERVDYWMISLLSPRSMKERNADLGDGWLTDRHDTRNSGDIVSIDLVAGRQSLNSHHDKSLKMFRTCLRRNIC